MEEQLKKLQETVEAQAKLITDLQSSKQQLDDTSAYINDTSILVSAIMKDPDLAARVQASIKGQPSQPAAPVVDPSNPATFKFDPATGKPIQAPTQQQPVQQQQPVAPQPDPRVNSLDGQKRQEIIDAVEKRFKVKDEAKKTLRPRVGTWLGSYNMDVTKIPVDQLEEKLSDAYLAIGLQDARATGATEAVIESFFEDPGKLPGMGSGGAAQDQTTLSTAQKKWTQKLDLPEDKVAAGLKELTENGVIAYKPKEQQQQTQQQPSGQPNPPVVPQT